MYTEAYINQIKDCAQSKFAKASYDAFIEVSYGLRSNRGRVDSRLLRMYSAVLNMYDTRVGATNVLTEQELSNIITSILKFPYPCTLGIATPITTVVTNTLPIVSAGEDKTINGLTTTIEGTASDPDGTISFILWSKVSGPGTVTFSAESALSGTVILSTPGTYVLQLLVKDNKGGVATDTVKIVCSQTIIDTIYFGKSATASIPIVGVLPDGQSVQADGANNITFNWGSIFNDFAYGWVLIPQRTAQHLKTHIYFANINSVTTIGQPGDLFNAPVSQTINGVTYHAYITDWQTILNGTVTFQIN